MSQLIMTFIIVNSADPDEMPRCADPDVISRHCLQTIHLQDGTDREKTFLYCMLTIDAQSY